MKLRTKRATPESRKLECQSIIKRLCFDYEKPIVSKMIEKKNDNDTPLEEKIRLNESIHKRKMKSYRSIRKIFLYINRIKLELFSFAPKDFLFWRSVAKIKHKLLSQVESHQNDENYTNNIEYNYLELVKKTLTLNDTKYAFKIGLLLHRRFNQDIALVIYDYLM